MKLMPIHPMSRYGESSKDHREKGKKGVELLE
jgi:hypothetical protein